MKIEEIKATNEWVVLKAVEVVEAAPKVIKNEKGIITPGNPSGAVGQNVNSNTGKVTVDLFIYDIGPKVPSDVTFKVGDCVLCDAYDMQTFEDDERQMFAICHYSKVKAILKVSRK